VKGLVLWWRSPGQNLEAVDGLSAASHAQDGAALLAEAVAEAVTRG
jgi:hypothetical protein